MVGLLLRRVELLIPTFFGVVFLRFIPIRFVPGDPVEVRVGE